MWSQSITIYNAYIAEDDELAYYPTVFSNAITSWKKEENRTNTGAENKSAATLYIRESDFTKPYLLEKEWGRIDPENIGGYFTAKEGDIFLPGIYEKILDESQMRELKNTKDRVFRITSVNYQEPVIKHLKIVGG